MNENIFNKIHLLPSNDKKALPIVYEAAAFCLIQSIRSGEFLNKSREKIIAFLY